MPIKKGLKAIQNEFLLLTDDEIEIVKVDNGMITIDFPRDTIVVQIDDIVRYVGELKEVTMSAERVSTPKFTQYPIDSNGDIHNIVKLTRLTYEKKGELKIRMTADPLLIGIGAVRLGFYEKYLPPCSTYHAVEIEYHSSDKRMTEQEELKQIKAFLFQYSRLAKVAVFLSKIIDIGDYEDDVATEGDIVHISSLPEYSEGMDLYSKAVQASDDEIRFLYFYKIIEYYSPIIAKRAAYESLSRKLEALKFNSASNKDLRSIYSLADKYRVSQSDKELAQTVLGEVIDIIDLFHLLPKSIQTKLSKANHFKSEEIDYNLKPDVIQAMINSIGAIMYSTRNSIVHAKSNYRSDGLECPGSDLPALNAFLQEACSLLILWHSKLPDHVKYEE